MAKIRTLAKTKLPKWRPFMKSGEVSRWKKQGSPQSMLKLTKKVK